MFTNGSNISDNDIALRLRTVLGSDNLSQNILGLLELHEMKGHVSCMHPERFTSEVTP